MPAISQDNAPNQTAIRLQNSLTDEMTFQKIFTWF